MFFKTPKGKEKKEKNRIETNGKASSRNDKTTIWTGLNTVAKALAAATAGGPAAVAVAAPTVLRGHVGHGAMLILASLLSAHGVCNVFVDKNV